MATHVTSGSLELLLEEREIERLLNGYGHAVDYGDSDAWAGSFTEDGAYEVSSRAADFASRKITPRSAIREYAENHAHAPEVWMKHVTVNPVIEIDGDTASVHSFWFLLEDVGGTAIVSGFGRYVDRLAKEDGKWRFRHRTSEIESLRPGYGSAPASS